ncbi:type II toxin-antitoxin system RelE/ParE family toxin [Fibrobacter sp.]
MQGWSHYRHWSCFCKKTQKTPKDKIKLAIQRLKVA